MWSRYGLRFVVLVVCNTHTCSCGGGHLGLAASSVTLGSICSHSHRIGCFWEQTCYKGLLLSTETRGRKEEEEEKRRQRWREDGKNRRKGNKIQVETTASVQLAENLVHWATEAHNTCISFTFPPLKVFWHFHTTRTPTCSQHSIIPSLHISTECYKRLLETKVLQRLFPVSLSVFLLFLFFFNW